MSSTGTIKKFDSVSMYRIRKLLSDLSNKTGRGTELVTLYLPPKKPIHEAIAALREESGTASNIKSDTTRSHVQDALTKTMQRLRLYNRTPENGLVIFCGAIPGPGGPGHEVIELYEVLPQKPVTTYLYRCDDHFHLDPLRDMLKEQNVIGILSVDSTEAGLGIVSGDVWDVVDVLSSGVSGKTRKGGQCVSSDTIVQLEDGRLMPISNISPGSRIASYDFTNYGCGTHSCADTFSFIPQEYFVVETIHPKMSIRATGEHRFFTVTEHGVSTIQSFQLKPGDRLLVSRRLPEPHDPVLSSRFPANYRYVASTSGRQVLKTLRQKRGLSQLELANVLGMGQTDVSQFERGERALGWDKLQKIIDFLCGSRDEFLAEYVDFRRTLPEAFTPDLLQLLGYVLGRGKASKDRLTLYEQRLEVAELYSGLAKITLNLDHVPILAMRSHQNSRSNTKRSYFEIRILFRDLIDALKQYYPELISAKARSIPEQLHRLDNKHLAYFMRGLFDAEVQASQTQIGIATDSELLVRQLQVLLSRFGIVSSHSQRVDRFGSCVHRLDIADFASLHLFRSLIGFSTNSAQERLVKLIAKVRSYTDAPAMESSADKRSANPKTDCQSDGAMNSETGIISRSVETVENMLALAQNGNASIRGIQLLEHATSHFALKVQGELILATVNKIQKVDNLEQEEFVDIELPLTQSFIGNCFVLHNSARRYERLREMELTDYFNRLADHAKKAFLDQYQIKGLIVSGPGPTKDDFVKDQYLDYRLQNMIVGTLDTGYAGREGVRETIEKSGKLLENVRVVEERKLVQRFLREVNTDSGLSIYGISDVLAALRKAAVDTILVNDDIDTVHIKAVCKKCGNVREKFTPRSQYVVEKQNLLVCPNCGSNEVEITERDIVDYLADASIDSGANVEVISSKTEDGAMMKSFGGVSALLRYRA